MDDLTITRLCARAAGKSVSGPDHNGSFWLSGGEWKEYAPLHNRAQALELVERLRLDITACYDGEWCVHWIPRAPLKFIISERDPDLLRAICLCAARVQQAREAM